MTKTELKIIDQSVYQNDYTTSPLVNALEIPALCNACDILFINGNLLRFSKMLEQGFFVSLSGPESQLTETIEYLAKRASSDLTELVRSAMPNLLEALANTAIKSDIVKQTIVNPEQEQKIVLKKVIEDIQQQKELTDLLQPFVPFLAYGIRPFCEAVIAESFRFLYGKVQILRKIVPNLSKTAQLLRNLEISIPTINISLCENCYNYEFTFSQSVRSTTSCQKCGQPSNSITLDFLSFPFSYLKIRNLDLSTFISRYIKSKIVLPIHVYPEVMIDPNGDNVQVDVYIAETMTGIECHCFENPVLTSDAKIDSLVAEMKKKVLNYNKIGLTRFICLTNLSNKYTENIEKQLKESLSKEISNIMLTKVLGWDLTNLHSFLNDEIKLITKTAESSFANEFMKKISVTHDKNLLPGETKVD